LGLSNSRHNRGGMSVGSGRGGRVGGAAPGVQPGGVAKLLPAGLGDGERFLCPFRNLGALFLGKAAYRCHSNGSTSGPSSAEMNGRRCAVKPEGATEAD
jgi:hypothetical protein